MLEDVLLYGSVDMSYMKGVIILGIAAFVGAVIGIVLYFTVLHRDKEGVYHGLKERLYNLMNFNRFYLEDMVRFLYIILACVLTVVGVVTIFTGAVFVGLVELVIGNILLRILCEVLMLLLILCRKTVAIDHKLNKIVDAAEPYAEDNARNDQ